VRRLLPLLAFALPALFAVSARTTMVQRDRAQFAETAEVTSRQAALRLEDYVRARLLAADTLRESMEAGPLFTEDAFQSRSEQIQERFGGFLALNWIDQSGVIRWVAPLEGNEAARGPNVLDHPTAAPFFQQSHTGRDVATPPLALFQGRRGFATYLPIGAPARGTLNGVFDIDRLVGDCFGSGLLDRWELGLDDDGEPAFRSAGFNDAPEALGADAPLSVVDRRWSLVLRPRPSLVAALGGGARDGFIAFGLLLAIGLGLSVRVTLVRTEQTAEAERQRARADLEREEANRKTGVLAEELEEVRRLEAIGRLAGGVAHDFNNLLTTITGSAGLLLEDLEGNPEGNPEDRGLLEDILQASHHGAELTGGLLAFARQQVLQPRSLDTGLELTRAQGLLARLVRANVVWEHVIPPDLWPVEMDPGELNRVIVNLAANGSDAMPAGGRLRLEASNCTLAEGAHPQVGAGDWVRIDVVDTGVGIPEEVRARIFEPFFSTKELGRGTGLGLASVYGAVRGAGGRVTVTSEVGEGTRFSLWFPRCEVAPEPLAVRSGAVRGVGQRVLLVDDQEALRRVAAKMLERAGYRLLEASNAAEAVDVAEEAGDVAVLVTDMVMPGGGGDELAHALLARWPDLAVVYTSGYTSDSFDVTGLLNERATYLPKPYDRRELAAAVHAVLQGKAGG